MAPLPPSVGREPKASPRRWRAVLNAASGGVGQDAVERMTALATEHGVELRPEIVQPKEIVSALKAAVEARPDVLVVLAGDGTLSLAAELCGPEGPLLAALPGGTMNMLPFALNGRLPWPETLAAILAGGEVLEVSGGEVGGRGFLVAAILGAPALWGDAREALRHGRFVLAVLRARRALLRAFKGRLRFSTDGGEKGRAEALTLMCPLPSRALRTGDGLEVAVLDLKGALDAVRLGLGALAGRWREAPSVRTAVCQEGTVWTRGRAPALLDGESHRFDAPVSFRYRPLAFRALVPPDSPALQQSRAGEEAATAPVAEAPVAADLL